MERESNSMQALCRSGCGFYGNPSTDGLCSLCYKEALKKKQQPPGPSPSASTQSAAQAYSAPTSNSVTTAFNTSNAKFMDTAIPTIPVVNALASAEKKDNNGRKKLFKSENDTRCSSSSSSSNSEDGDVIIRKTSSALDARSSPYPARALSGGAGAAAAALKGGSEAPTDLVYEYLTRDHRAATREPSASASVAAADKIRTNLKIVRIRKFQSNESKVLLIVDVPPTVRQQQLEQQQKQQQPPPPHPLAGAPETPSPSLDMGSREIFELSDELAKKFDVDRETSKSFEWRSFSRPDDVIKLLLNDGGVKSVQPMAAGGRDEQPAKNDGCDDDDGKVAEKSTIAAAAQISSSSCIIVEEDDVAADDEDGCGGLAKPATKKKRISAADDRELAVATGFERDDRAGYAGTDQPKMRPRSRLVRGLLGKHHNVLNACGGPKNKAAQPLAGPRTTASTETTTMSTINKYRDTMVDETWKILKNCATLRRENVDTLHVLLGEDNVKGVSNCGADTSTSDANDDALNSSSSDDNDGKAKKKNRCALCRKKVGLTGFECRCGGLYCGMHRYSDKHNCTFDYRQLGAQEIRRNNPVVIGEKIQKI